MKTISETRWSVVRAVSLVVVGLACANALLYSAMTATPIVQADSWYFLDTFVRHYSESGLRLADFLHHRGGSDHSQPLFRLLLLLHLHFFQLDFWIEGLIGAGFGVVTALVSAHIFTADSKSGTGISAVIAAAIVALVLSLNSTNIYTWPLVTLGFVSLFFLLLTALVSWRVFVHGRGYLGLSFVAGLTLSCGDKFAILGFIAAALALLLLSRSKTEVKTLARLVMVLAAVTILFELAAAAAAPVTAVQGPASSPRAISLGELVRALQDVLTTSLLHRTYLGPGVPSAAGMVLGLLLAVLHALFWWSFSWRKIHASRSAFVAATLMLLAYATVAGVLWGRTGTYGVDYLQQPRYVLFYQLMNVALLLRFGTLRLTEEPARYFVSWRGLELIAPLLAGLALVVQPIVTLRAWDFAKYVSQYQQVAAMQIGAMTADRNYVPSPCADILVVCNYSADKRSDVLGFLKARELNVFSRRFQMLHRLYPDPDSVPRSK